MSFIPNMRRRKAPPVTKFPYIDNLFDYGAFLQQSVNAVGTIPPTKQNARIAVVGGGVAGMVTAYELLRAGAANVVIFEANTEDAGGAHGRTYSRQFFSQGPQEFYLAELGAMRFPPTEVGLFYYLDKFGIAYTPNFPDPGAPGVLTQISYQGQNALWQPGQKPPAQFSKVHDTWVAFVTKGVKLADGTTLMAPADIGTLLENGQLDQAKQAWQAYINVFENTSFYNGLVKVFAQPNAPGSQPWTLPQDFQLFGALGVGSGGFGPLYAIGFLEIVRLIVNGLETDQQFVPKGIQSLVTSIGNQKFNGSPLSSRIQYNKRVVGISKVPQQKLRLDFDDSTNTVCDRVVLATSNRSAQIAGLSAVADGTGLLTAQQCTALENVHMTNSSKVFIMTPTKFWLKDKTLPSNIQSDTLTRGTYCLDYTDDPDGYGVVLLSYTWEDDATKQMGLGSKKERVQRLVADIAQVNPKFAQNLVPVNGDYDIYTQVIDWQTEQDYFGAFKLNPPGVDGLSQQLFFQFQAAGTSGDTNVYLAGDSYSYTGGWVEGAVQTALNATCAVIRSLQGSFIPQLNPIDDMSATAYNYYPATNATNA